MFNVCPLFWVRLVYSGVTKEVVGAVIVVIVDKDVVVICMIFSLLL